LHPGGTQSHPHITDHYKWDYEWLDESQTLQAWTCKDTRTGEVLPGSFIRDADVTIANYGSYIRKFYRTDYQSVKHPSLFDVVAYDTMLIRARYWIHLMHNYTQELGDAGFAYHVVENLLFQANWF
jgi:hypothetical protein